MHDLQVMNTCAVLPQSSTPPTRVQSYGGIEDGLQALEVTGWESCEHDIAVVQTTVYKACDERVESERALAEIA